MWVKLGEPLTNSYFMCDLGTTLKTESGRAESNLEHDVAAGGTSAFPLFYPVLLPPPPIDIGMGCLSCFWLHMSPGEGSRTNSPPHSQKTCTQKQPITEFWMCWMQGTTTDQSSGKGILHIMRAEWWTIFDIPGGDVVCSCLLPFEVRKMVQREGRIPLPLLCCDPNPTCCLACLGIVFPAVWCLAEGMRVMSMEYKPSS